MNSQKSRKIIVAGGMAVVVGILAVVFALRSQHDPMVAQAPHPPTPIAEVPAAPAAVAQTPDITPAVAQAPDVPVVAHNDVGTKAVDTATPSAVEPKLAPKRHLAKADTSAAATTDTGTRTGSAAETSEKPAAETVGDSADRVKSAEESTTTPATSSSPADNQSVGTSTEVASSDSQITTDVKSQLAGDSLSKDLTIGVTTTHGVVALTGTLASQDAIDHAKDVAGKVKDVKSVDASALILASL